MELVKKTESLNILKKIIIVISATLLLTVSAKIKVPFYPVPMTMQTFVVVLIGITLGWKLGLATIFLYLFEGAIGSSSFCWYTRKRYWNLVIWLDQLVDIYWIYFFRFYCRFCKFK